MPNRLYYGDNLDVLRREIASESVDLVYLDPPFNSQVTYNVLFRSPTGERTDAQIEAFKYNVTSDQRMQPQDRDDALLDDLFLGVDSAICTVQYHLRNARSDVSMISTDGIRNVIVHGRSVYHVIERTLKGKVTPDFHPWWEGKKFEMSGDELISMFRTMRDAVLKEGTLPVEAVYPGGFSFHGGTGYAGASPPPPGKTVTRQIMSHQLGGLAWETMRADGTREYFPAKFPSGMSPVLYPERATLVHLGKTYSRPSMLSLCEKYVTYWEHLLLEARRTFRCRKNPD